MPSDNTATLSLSLDSAALTLSLDSAALVLSLDSAATGCAVALLRGDVVLAQQHESMARGQDTRLITMVQDVLATARVEFSQIQRVAVLRGPGSFTGLRIGLAAARGLGLALDIPVLGIDRFMVYCHAFVAVTQPLLVVIDSRRAEAFCQFFHPNQPLQPPFLATAAQLAAYDSADMMIAGDGAKLHEWQTATFLDLPQPEVIYAALLAQNLAPEQALPLPLYLRPPEVSHGPTPPQEEGLW